MKYTHIQEGGFFMNKQKELLENHREKLESLIESNASYEDIVKASQELDKYITMYYKSGVLNEL